MSVSSGSVHGAPTNAMPTGSSPSSSAGTATLGYPDTAAIVELATPTRSPAAGSTRHAGPVDRRNERGEPLRRKRRREPVAKPRERRDRVAIGRCVEPRRLLRLHEQVLTEDRHRDVRVREVERDELVERTRAIAHVAQVLVDLHVELVQQHRELGRLDGLAEPGLDRVDELRAERP